jgi:hypothetical protein
VGSYYFLAAQLPYLIYGQAAPIKSDDFLEMARNSLNSNDAAVLGLCVLNPPEGPKTSHGFINSWREWERALRLNLARNRAQKLKRDGAPDAPEHPAGAVAAARAALAMDSPLDAEIFLGEARWKAIENFQGLSLFNENAMYAYLLKLRLCERRQAFKTEEGFSEYKTLYDSILKASKPTGELE